MIARIPRPIGPTTNKSRAVRPRGLSPSSPLPTSAGGDPRDITIEIPDSAPEAEPASPGSLRGSATTEFSEESLTWSGKGLAGIYAAVKVLAQGQSALWERVKCDPTQEGSLAVPEWWAVRPGANIPQLCVVLREVNAEGKLLKSQWSFTIPHYIGKSGEVPNLPPFRKGSYFGTLTLSDNTKVVVNAASTAEAEAVINAVIPYIDPSFLEVLNIHLGQRKGAALREVNVKPYRAQFYSQGQKETIPDFTIEFP